MDEISSEPPRSATGASGVSACRGVRGATAVAPFASPEALGQVVGEMLRRILDDNRARTEEIAAVIFTVPEDLDGANPAAAARSHGFESVPLLVVREHGGDQRVPRCLRVLVLLNTHLAQSELRHAYLRGTQLLRPDLLPKVGDQT